MHELSIAQSIAEIVLQHIPGKEGVSVRSVRLTLGAMAGVVPDSLEFCFSAIAEGTPLEGAHLEIEHVPLTAHCNSCGADGEIEPTLFACGRCGGTSLHVLSGREMQVRDIEIEEHEGVR
ncbi:MAG TPA: hydrogenase maturation nickel metallochaperone HypA [Bacteroidota bacterium]|nr:hydrogenase maturation nickel metallochaperone HypA [Bacteroidota bacterium]